MTDLKPAEQRVAAALEQHALPGRVIVLDQLATTAQMAAEALNVEVGRIVKSLLFRGEESGRPILILVSGSNRVHEKRTGKRIGEALDRPDADFVKLHTGFSIGGVSPFGHPEKLPTYLDDGLFAFETVWAAAGDPRSVFEITPADLLRATGAERIEVV